MSENTSGMIGLRVVRGPDWKHANEDGGESHVGTVTNEKPENTVTVQWDMGSSSTCKVGDGVHELRVFDSAPVGICHKNTACVVCEDMCVYGTIWRCTECADVTLCSVCYHGDEHDSTHPFNRIDIPDADMVRVPKRSSSQRSRSLGIYPTATVARGPDWCDDNHKVGVEGTVEDIVCFGEDSTDRNGARVRWANGNTDTYRLGHDGKVDLICTEEAPGPMFYPTHLPVLDAEIFGNWDASELLSSGDKVCVEISVLDFKQLQGGTWNRRMEEIIGEIGVVAGFTDAGDVEVNYDGDSMTINIAAVSKVPEHNKGDKVTVRSSKVEVKRLQHRHGGWDDDMNSVLGAGGTVSAIDKDGDVGVTFDNGHAFVFHPLCLIPLETGLPGDEFLLGNACDIDSDPPEGEEEPESDAEEGENEGKAAFAQLFAGLLLLQAIRDEVSTDGNQAQRMVNAVQAGDESTVKQLLKDNPDMKGVSVDGIPIQHIATFKGHKGVLGILLDAGANINAEDKKANTPLLLAIVTDHPECATLLIERGADLNSHNDDGRRPAHVAAYQNQKDVLALLLGRGCDPNAQDAAGDTPLHDAISERHDSTATLLIEHPDVNVWLQNNKHFNPMHLACIKGHSMAVDKLLTREMKLGTTAKNDGFMPLHICAVNNHVTEASILLIKGRVDVNARSNQRSTALSLACREAYFDIVELLLTYDADWKIADVNGDTPLHSCMMARRTNQKLLLLLGLRNLTEDNERVKIANFLYQHGAKLDVKNNAGQTPITGCPIQTMKDAVNTYAANNTPTKPEPRQQRPKTAKVAQAAHKTARQTCHKCSTNRANIKFEPCKHKVSCEKCCYKFKRCPICNKPISKRLDGDGKAVDSERCTIL